MRLFADTEFFCEEGLPAIIWPISIGIVAEDGREFYAEFQGAREAGGKTNFLRDNVLPNLKGNELPVEEIRQRLEEFVGSATRPEFLMSYGAYDWVVICQIFGSLLKVPGNWQWIFTELVPADLPRVERVGEEHNALADAATLRKAWLAKFGEK
jgi:hypothetical protein